MANVNKHLNWSYEVLSEQFFHDDVDCLIQRYISEKRINIKTAMQNQHQDYSYNTEYIGKTKRHYRTRTSEYIGVPPLTGKYLKNNSQTSAVHNHMLFCKTVVCPEDFSILAKSSCNFKLEIQESILIKLLKPNLNKSISSVPLYLV